MANEWQLEKAENAAVAGAREVLSLRAELVAVRAALDAILKARAELDASNDSETLMDEESIARHTAKFVAFDQAIRAAAAGTGPTTRADDFDEFSRDENGDDDFGESGPTGDYAK